MIKPDQFPYITLVSVNDSFNIGKFEMNLHDYKPFSHLIITGRNGSGKTTILRSIDTLYFDSGRTPKFRVSSVEEDISNKVVHIRELEGDDIKMAWAISLKHSISYRASDKSQGSRLLLPYEYSSYLNNSAVYFYYRAVRDVKPDIVEGPVKDTEFIGKLNDKKSTEFFLKKFKQYLVNKKIDQAFSQINNSMLVVDQIESFFATIREKLSIIFDLPVRSIDFDHNNYEFYINTFDDKRLTFDKLSEGFSAVVGIMISLLVKVDIIRKQQNNHVYDPCGIVLIDEPETHLHLELQEQVLPLLTDLFPNIQFIVATHSPAVIASIRNATIFDLTTKETRVSEDTVGRSYAELTTSHFGLENDYSTIADEYVKQIDAVLDLYGNKPAELIQKLEDWQRENAQFLSPTLQIKLEYIIAQQNAKLAVSQ